MRLDEIRTLISKSDQDDWEKIGCWGAGSGPSYLESFSVWTGPSKTWGLDVESHSVIAVFRDDVDLRIAWGWDPDDAADHRNLYFPWQEKLPDSKVTRFYADVFWRGALVDRMMMLSVDGGRAYMPLGRPKYEDKEWITEVVPDWEYKFTRLVHSFEHTDSYETYFQRVGFTRA